MDNKPMLQYKDILTIVKKRIEQNKIYIKEAQSNMGYERAEGALIELEDLLKELDSNYHTLTEIKKELEAKINDVDTTVIELEEDLKVVKSEKAKKAIQNAIDCKMYKIKKNVSELNYINQQLKTPLFDRSLLRCIINKR